MILVKLDPDSLVMAMTDSTITDGITQYTDGHSYEVPRPFLTLQQAAAILGKSIRSIERSLSGRWGAKLPDGWVGRKLRTERGEEWRILPPPGFRVKLSGAPSLTNGGADGDSTEYDTVVTESFEMTQTNHSESFAPTRQSTSNKQVRSRHTLEQPTIVIDRSEEVEHLLRELVVTQKALSEERRIHLDDLRTIHQLQSSMRLLEVNAHEQSKLKQELDAAKAELDLWKEKFEREANTPWWRKMFATSR
jgi:hypothetical protein